MLRADKNATFVVHPPSISGLFKGRHGFRSGKKVFDIRWKRDWYERAFAMQQTEPVQLFSLGARTYWWFHDGVFWEDDGLSGDDVKALVLQRERKAQRTLQTAHSLMRAEEEGRPTRVPVPVEVRRAVFERDGGRCVECGSNFDLQYDHILPVAHGGATTVENLQLLCADCNQRKSDSL
jgi:HNH endonuclease